MRTRATACCTARVRSVRVLCGCAGALLPRGCAHECDEVARAARAVLVSDPKLKPGDTEPALRSLRSLRAVPTNGQCSPACRWRQCEYVGSVAGGWKASAAGEGCCACGRIAVVGELGTRPSHITPKCATVSCTRRSRPPLPTASTRFLPPALRSPCLASPRLASPRSLYVAAASVARIALATRGAAIVRPLLFPIKYCSARHCCCRADYAQVPRGDGRRRGQGDRRARLRRLRPARQARRPGEAMAMQRTVAVVASNRPTDN